jgi:hypothetical protein
VQQQVGDEDEFGDALQVGVDEGGEVEALGELGEDIGDGVSPGEIAGAAFGFGVGSVDGGVGSQPVFD